MSEHAGHGVKYSHRRSVSRIATAPAKGAAEPDQQAMLASMQPEELRGAMADLGHGTQSGLARAIGVDRSTVSLWLEGRVGVPRPVAKLIRMMVLHEARVER